MPITCHLYQLYTRSIYPLWSTACFTPHPEGIYRYNEGKTPGILNPDTSTFQLTLSLEKNLQYPLNKNCDSYEDHSGH